MACNPLYLLEQKAQAPQGQPMPPTNVHGTGKNDGDLIMEGKTQIEESEQKAPRKKRLIKDRKPKTNSSKIKSDKRQSSKTTAASRK
jgi:hypothetical protein